MNTEQLASLYEKLELKSRRGRGGNYSYVPWQDVADRMNKVFGGNWSSEVMSETVVGNGVVLRVRVTVIDKETNVSYYQEGFGGADNTGSEVGTLHKSAYSKALRDACKKWGPGLYTDEYDDASSHKGSPPVNPPSAPVSIPVASASVPVKDTKKSTIPAALEKPVVPSTSIPAVSVPSTSIPVTPKAENTPTNPVVEKIAAATSIPGAQPPIVPPAVETKPSLPPVSTGSVPMQTAAIPTQNTENVKINDVQLAALDGILEIKNIDPELLIKGAFEEGKLDTTDLPTKEMLSYQQAVLVIKYGNEKFRT